MKNLFSGKSLFLFAMTGLFTATGFAEVTGVALYKHVMPNGSLYTPNCIFAIATTDSGKIFVSPVGDCGGMKSTEELLPIADQSHNPGSLQNTNRQHTYVLEGENYNLVVGGNIVGKLIKFKNAN